MMIFIFFLLVSALCLSAGHHLTLTRRPAGNQTTTGNLSAIQESAIPTEPRGHLTDDDFHAAQCFMEVIRAYSKGVVQPCIMLGLQATGAVRATLELIIPSLTGLIPEQWKQTATLCLQDWLSNYSLLRLWHTPKSLCQFAEILRKQLNHWHILPLGNQR